MRAESISFHGIPSIGYAITASHDSGKKSLPVAPAAYIYSHFKHVSGVPASEGVRGVPISKLKILDTLIEQLVRMKKQPVPPVDAADLGSGDRRVDALIEQYQSQIRAVQAAAVPFNAGMVPATGTVVSVAA